jgi:hypothetical protein
MKVSGEKLSANHESARDFIKQFEQFISDENLSPEQVYNADKTSLFWRYIPRKTYKTAEVGLKDAKVHLSSCMCQCTWHA